MRAVNLLSNAAHASDSASGAGAADSTASPRTGAYAVLGLLAVAALAAVTLVLVGNQLSAAQQSIADTAAKQTVAQAEVARLQPYGQFRAIAASRVETVRSLASTRFDWGKALNDLSRAVPGDVTVSGVTGSVSSGISSPGGAANPLRAAIDAPAIELTGCAKDQPAVAELMARLRAIRGVTRVSLSSSTKAAEDAQAGPATPDAKPSGCGKGSRPEWSTVVFFERAEAAAAGSSSGAGAGAAPGAAPAPAPSTSGAPAAPAPNASASPTATPTDGSAALTEPPADSATTNGSSSAAKEGGN